MLEASKKIKDLLQNKSLGGVKVKTPEGFIGYWVSQWPQGVWLRKEIGDSEVHPVFVKSLKECLEWKVIED